MDVVYTAILGGHDTLKPQPLARDTLVAFLEEPVAAPAPWTVRAAPPFGDVPRRLARRLKILSHVFFPDHEYTLWIDGSILFLSALSVKDLVERHMAGCDVLTFRHKSRRCVYEEARHCARLGLDDPGTIRRQMEAYADRGHPQGAGLVETCVLLRRRCEAVRRFNEAWWEEVRSGSCRDQLSFNVVAAAEGLRLATLPGHIEASSIFQRGPHDGPRAPRG